MKYLHVLLVLGFLAFQSAVAQVTISEIMARNTGYIFNTESYNFDDWVEISNLGSSAQNLGGMYLSDDKTQPQKWAFPTYTLSAKSVFVVWFGSDNQIFGRPGFKLKSEGGSLYIYRNTGVLVDSVRYPAQYPNISWGKGSDNVWGYFQKPTAFNLNNLASYLSFAGSITASETAGRYSGSISVSLTAPAGNEIRYTIDGAEPRANSTLYSGPIWVGKTQVIRARCFAPNKLPGDLYTATYFIGEHDFSLPVVSVCTDPRYLWNDTVGIHVWGKNGIEGNCVGLANFNRDWERPFVVEHFEPQGKRNFVVHAKGEIGGGCSRSSHDMKSLNFDMSSKYGDKSLNFPLFKSKKLPAYKSFMLRNSGNDVNVTQMRDAFLQTLIEGVTEIDHLAYQPATMYLNGEYRGIMNIRERSDADYLMANYGLDTDQVDMVSINNFVNVVAGSEMPYKNLLETLTSMDMSSAAAYQFLDDNIDLPEYINYLVTQIYLANTDWPGNNTKAWRAHKAGAKWRWILYDLDFGAGIWDGPSDHRTLDFVTESNGPNWPNPPVSTLLIRKALESPKFKERFIQCFYTQIDNTFNLTRVNHVCDSLRNNILTEMPFHKQRWGGSVADMDWELNKMRDWFRRRNEFLPDYIRQFFGLNSPTNVLIKNTAPKMGKLWFNEAIVTTPEMSTQATTGLRVSFRAQANTGYAFDKWNIKHQEITALQFVKRGDSWAYWDKGTMPTNWQQPEFDASTWAVGNAQFGYGESDEATVLSFGTNSSQKYPTSYFRKEFKVDAPTTLSDLKLQILCDDGVLVYLNGVEVGRINMPDGAVGYDTWASVNAEENVYLTMNIDKGLFKAGNNVLAVEVHQVGAESSDVSFDLSLDALVYGAQTTEELQGDTQSFLVQNSFEIEPIYIEKSCATGLKINELVASNNTLPDAFGEKGDWFEVHNTTNADINMAGMWLTDNFSRKNKYEIPQNQADKTTVPAHGFLVFWADEAIWKDASHTNFKLEASGERVGIYQFCKADTVLIDTMSYKNLNTNWSLGRFPDGTSNIILMPVSSPLSANIQSAIPLGIAAVTPWVTIYPNPNAGVFRLACSEFGKPLQLRIWNSQGVCVFTQIIMPEQVIDVSQLGSGLYFFDFGTGDTKLTQRILIMKP